MSERDDEEERLRIVAQRNAQSILLARLEAEETLRKQTEWLRVTLASIGDAVISTDAEGRVTFMNGVAEAVTGWMQSEALGRSLTDVFHIVNEQTRQPAENPALRALREGTVVGLANHTVLIARDGTERPIDDSAAPMRDESGTPIGAVLVFRDVTERRRAEELLRRKEAELSDFLENANVGLHWVGRDGTILWANKAELELLGYCREEYVGRNIVEFHMDRAVIDDILCRLLSKEQLHGYEARLRCKDGSVKHVLINSNGLWEGEQFVHTRCFTHDITDRKRAEEAQARLAAIVESSDDAIVSKTLDSIIRSWNAGAERLFGYTAAEAVGRSITLIIPPERLDEESMILSRLRRGERVDHFETVRITKDGRRLDISLTISPIHDAEGRIIGASKIARDVTGQKVAERSLRESQEQLAAELEAMTRLHALSTRLVAMTDLRAALGDILEEAIRACRADFGNVQLYNPQSQALEIVAQHGFREDFLEYFRTARWDEGSCCAQAMQSGAPVVIEDVECDPSYELHRQVAAAAGYRAVQSTPLKSRDGRILGMLSTHFREPHRPSKRDGRLLDLYARLAADLIERLSYEDALRQSEARFRELADAMPQIVWTAGSDGVIDYSNRRWFEFSGSSVGVGNDGWRVVIHPDDRPKAVALWATSRRDGTAFEMEVRLLDRRTGGYRWHLMRTLPAHDEAGRVVRWYGSATDIDQQKRAEESARFLAEASAALATVVDYQSTLQKVANLAVPYFADWAAVDVTGEDGSLRRLAVAHQNPDKVRLAQELGRRYPPDPDAPRGIIHVICTGQPEIVEEITDELLVQSARDEEHLRLVRSLGLKSYLCVPLVVSGKAVGALTFATAESGRRYSRADLMLAEDLSHRAAVAIENANLYQALKEEDRRKTEFLALLAHELRNPMAPLRNGLQVLRLASNNGPAAQEAQGMMERQLHHLVRLVDDLLDVSRISRGKIQLRKERLNVAEVIRSAVETCEPLIKKQEDELTVTLPEQPVYVDADSTRLTQAVCNLVSNAAKYSDRDSRIWLTVAREGEQAVIRVKDTGIGIPANMLPKVFDLFTQVDRSLEKAQGGLGVGLTIVKRLVELHGGTIEAHSEGYGKGSEFVVRLPAVAPAVQESHEPDIAPPRRTVRHRILVVDDNVDSASSLALLLQFMGNEVRTAYNGVDGVEMAKAFRPDVILLDIGMPKLNGYDACRRIRELPWGRKPAIVALTGWGQEEDIQRSQEAGFDHHLVKPIEPAALEKLLAELPTRLV
jgi:PAS domain S-box-containing protein